MLLGHDPRSARTVCLPQVAVRLASCGACSGRRGRSDGSQWGLGSLARCCWRRRSSAARYPPSNAAGCGEYRAAATLPNVLPSRLHCEILECEATLWRSHPALLLSMQCDDVLHFVAMLQLILVIRSCGRGRVAEANRRLLEERRRGAASATARGLSSGDGTQSGAGNGGGDRPNNTCVVCLEHAPNTVFTACGHLAVCWDCGSLLNRCPICRSPSRAVKVYTV